MNLYISGSNRKKNCYKILKDLKEKEDVLINLADKQIQYCLGCNKCLNNLKEICVIQDDMQEIYDYMRKADKIVLATPIYMNHITGILKNMIDRWNPYNVKPVLLKGKKIYLITVGQMSEEENEEVVTDIKRYFEGLSEFMEFEFEFLKNFSSGDIKEIDDVKLVYEDYEQIIQTLKKQVG